MVLRLRMSAIARSTRVPPHLRTISTDRTLTQVAFGTGGPVLAGQPEWTSKSGHHRLQRRDGADTRCAPHRLIFDPFTDLMLPTMSLDGAGATGTMDAANGSGLLTSGSIFGVGDFDQGAVDGFGHALVAGSGAITFIDYHLSGDITDPDFVTNRFNAGGVSFSRHRRRRSIDRSGIESESQYLSPARYCYWRLASRDWSHRVAPSAEAKRSFQPRGGRNDHRHQAFRNPHGDPLPTTRDSRLEVGSSKLEHAGPAFSMSRFLTLSMRRR